MEITAILQEDLSVVGTEDPLLLHLLSVALKALAESRACTLDTLDGEWQAGEGDIEIDSLEAIYVFAAIEGVLNRTLPGVEGLPAEEMLSVRAVVAFVCRYLFALDSEAGSSDEAAG
jgi:hypothetical protein